MNIQSLAERRQGIHPYGKSATFVPPIKIDEARSDEEEIGAEVKDIPFYKPYRQGLGGPQMVGPSPGNRPRRNSLDRSLDPSNSGKRTVSPSPNKSAKVLHARADVPQRTR